MKRKSKSPVLSDTDDIPKSPEPNDAPAGGRTPRSADAAEVLLSLGQMWIMSPTTKLQSPSNQENMAKRSPWVVTPIQERQEIGEETELRVTRRQLFTDNSTPEGNNDLDILEPLPPLEDVFEHEVDATDAVVQDNNATNNEELFRDEDGMHLFGNIDSSDKEQEGMETHELQQGQEQLIIVNPQTKVQTQRQVLTYEFCMSQSEQEFRRLTGLYQPQFLALLEFLGKDVADALKYRSDRKTPKKQKNKKIDSSPTVSTETRLLITLLRMRRGWDVEDLALFFGVSTFLVSKTIYTWVQFMYFQFKRMQREMFVSRHLQKRADRPVAFKPFDNFRVCIDTTEVRIQSPDNLEQQGNTFNDYKGGNVWLYLICISSWGGISYISPGFEGSMSDVDIYNQSGIREFLEPGDVVLADRGFRVEEECDEDGVVLIHPPFLRGRSQFTAEEEMLTKEIAKARIFVEHLVRKIKVFKVLKKVTNNMLHYLDQMVYVAGCLINFMPHVVKNKPKEDQNKGGQKKAVAKKLNK